VADGLPVGLQIVTKAWEEAKLLAIARFAEDCLPAIAEPRLG
jgi:Asp-tRNA(Asn)/Glu-tRNA(Gln) amidotransferase A subunit family amidase